MKQYIHPSLCEILFPWTSAERVIKQRIALILMGMVLSPGTLQAQNTTSAPTSMYGLGEMNMNNGGKYNGLGNAGLALNRKGFLNSLNPACLTRTDSTTFLFDIGATASYSQYSMLGEKKSTGNGNLSRIALGFRLFPHWYTAVGMAPYSSMGYLIKSSQEIEGSPGNYISSLFEGNGGLCRFYLTNSFLIGQKLSIGANIGLVSGTVEQTESQEYATLSTESGKKAFYADLGMHYQLNRKWAIAATYAFPSHVNQDNTLTYDNSSTDTGLEQNYRTYEQYLPQSIGGGVSYETHRWVLTGDYNWRQWSRNQSSNVSVKYIDQHQLNLGAIYVTRPEIIRPSMEIMAGAGFSNSYIELSKGKMYNLDLNAGIAIPIRESILSIGINWRKQLNTRSNLMQESRFTLNFNLTFGERILRLKIQ